MTILLVPGAATAKSVLKAWRARLRHFSRSSANAAEDRKISEAIRQLSKFDDHQLNDIGLARSDLTPDGLAAAGARRRHRQAVIDAEIATSKRALRSPRQLSGESAPTLIASGGQKEAVKFTATFPQQFGSHRNSQPANPVCKSAQPQTSVTPPAMRCGFGGPGHE